MSVYHWSTTAANNATADAAINWAEGQNANTVNNSARAMMAASAAFLAQTNGSITSGGSANAQTFTSPSGFAFTAYAAGQIIVFKAGFTNTASATLNVDGLGAVTMKKYGGDNLQSGDIESGMVIYAIHDGTNFQIISALANDNLEAFGGLTGAADRLAYFTSATTMSLATFTSFARAILDDADAATVRATLGLGTMSTQASGSVSITGGTVTGITDIAVADGGTGASTAANARSNLGIGTIATRDFTASTSAPSGGADGDVWFRYA